MFLFGFLKFFQPFHGWFEVQIQQSHLPHEAILAGKLGEMVTGILFLLPWLWRSLTAKSKDLLLLLASSMLVAQMGMAIYVHLQPQVPASVLPLGIKTPVIPAFVLLLALLTAFDVWKDLRGEAKASKRIPDSHIPWPAEHAPATARVFAQNIVDVAASPQAVWSQLIDCVAWPQWYKHCSDVSILRGGWCLSSDSKFRFKTLGFYFEPEVVTFEPHHTLVWSARGPAGTSGSHAWYIEATPGGCRVITEESQSGLLLFFLGARTRNLYAIWRVRSLRARPSSRWRVGPVPANTRRAEWIQVALAVLKQHQGADCRLSTRLSECPQCAQQQLRRIQRSSDRHRSRG